MIFEAINGELQNLQASTSTSSSANSSAQIIESFFKSLNTFLENYSQPVDIIEQLNEASNKQTETIKKLKLEIKNLKDLISDLNNKKEKKQQNGAGDSELIRHLSAKVSKTLAVNSSLKSKLKVANSEIESLKKLVISFRNGASVTSNGQKNPSKRARFSESIANLIENTNIDSEDQQEIDNYLNSNQSHDYDDDDDDEETKESTEDDDDEDFNLDEGDDEEDEDEEEEQEDEEDENINYHNYFNSLNDSSYNNATPTVAKTNQRSQSQEIVQNDGNIGDFIAKFYDKLTNTIFALPDYINTEDVVLKMRDFMQRYKINQCDAGNRIIGVKKSHVSFLLSNLKTWEMLTRKGKEPYTRMFLFFYNVNEEGPDNVKKYFNNTYALPKIDLLAVRMSSGITKAKLNDTVTTETTTVVDASTTLDSTSLDVDLSELEHIIIPYDITSVSENECFDTNELTERLKEILKANRVSQELFCRAVLNLSDRILCKPKPWNFLGKKAREHYIRIHLFLNDPLRFEKLNDWKEKHFSN